MNAAGAPVVFEGVTGALRDERSPLAHLLHAINQPLTGLQCSLEVAAAGPRPAEEYVRTLREGLQLIERLRILVEAVRELVDTEPGAEAAEMFQFDTLLKQATADLVPLAEEKNVGLLLTCDASLPVRGKRRSLTTLIFRFFESVLSLARVNSDMKIVAALEQPHIKLVVSWKPGSLPEHSPFSRQELGLLISRSGFERAGAGWTSTQEEASQTCTVRLPMASSTAILQSCAEGNLP
jgi:hypothetical protein